MGHYVETSVYESKKFVEHLLICLKWVCLSLCTGILVGLICAAFSMGMKHATEFREANEIIIWFLPLAGIVITFLYEFFGKHVSKGTNMALSAINSNEDVPWAIMPLIFISGIVSHLFGASVGREGAALQMGAGFGNSFAKLLKLNDNDKKILIMTGMSAAFSALLGTPLAAAIFSIEVISVGVMYYSALVPCTVSALTAISVTRFLGVQSVETFTVAIPDFTPFTAGMSMLLGVLCAVVSILVCVTLILFERGFIKVFNNPYVRALFGGAVVAALTFVLGTHDYNGLGSAIIEAALDGHALWYAFILKLLFTAVSLSSGYKGGEIVPVLFIGATFGCTVGGLLGMPPAFCAALGMIAVFCGVTNAPLASIIIGVEMFGAQGLWFFCLAAAVSYMLSGYYGLYKSQLIIYSKYRSVYVRKSAHR